MNSRSIWDSYHSTDITYIHVYLQTPERLNLLQSKTKTSSPKKAITKYKLPNISYFPVIRNNYILIIGTKLTLTFTEPGRGWRGMAGVRVISYTIFLFVLTPPAFSCRWLFKLICRLPLLQKSVLRNSQGFTFSYVNCILIWAWFGGTCEYGPASCCRQAIQEYTNSFI